MNVPMLDLRQEIDEIRPQIDEAIRRVVDSTQFIGGPEVRAFEDEAKTYLGCAHAVSCNSGTDALLLGLRGCGIKSGDEVITSPFSFFATAEPISLLGATPVFVDIDEESFNLDLNAAANAITERTTAIVPVHLYGRPIDVPAVNKLAKQAGLRVIEDTAQAFGAMCHGRRAGTIGHAGAFSFFPSKTLGAFGDGGMLTTDDEDLALTARKLRAHGALTKYKNEILGYNSRLDALQAAVLRLKLGRIDGQNRRRRQVAQRYNEEFKDLEEVVSPTAVTGHVFHQYTLRILGDKRDALAATLKAQGIATMVYYPTPIHRLPVYEREAVELPRAERAAREVLSLPIWPGMPEGTQHRVIAAIRAFFDKT
jgi:dTDP-4-amino-4,6-dideoxygalactose transaminase